VTKSDKPFTSCIECRPGCESNFGVLCGVSAKVDTVFCAFNPKHGVEPAVTFNRGDQQCRMWVKDGSG